MRPVSRNLASDVRYLWWSASHLGWEEFAVRPRIFFLLFGWLMYIIQCITVFIYSDSVSYVASPLTAPMCVFNICLCLGGIDTRVVLFWHSQSNVMYQTDCDLVLPLTYGFHIVMYFVCLSVFCVWVCVWGGCVCYIGTVVTFLLKVEILKVHGIAIAHVFAIKH